MDRAAKIVMLPGMGADARLFGAQLGAFPGLEVWDWVDPRGCGTVAEYAGRLAEAHAGVVPEVIGGVSFGGAVALELGCRLNPRGVLLISAPREWGEVRLPLRVAASLLPGWVAGRMAKVGVRVSSPLGVMFGASRGEDVRLLVEMLVGTPTGLLEWAIGALARWEGPRPGCVVRRVHGTRDRLIRPGGKVDHWVAGGGHLLPVTHPGEVNGALRGLLEGLGEGGVRERAGALT